MSNQVGKKPSQILPGVQTCGSSGALCFPKFLPWQGFGHGWLRCAAHMGDQCRNGKNKGKGKPFVAWLKGKGKGKIMSPGKSQAKVAGATLALAELLLQHSGAASSSSAPPSSNLDVMWQHALSQQPWSTETETMADYRWHQAEAEAVAETQAWAESQAQAEAEAMAEYYWFQAEAEAETEALAEALDAEAAMASWVVHKVSQKKQKQEISDGQGP